MAAELARPEGVKDRGGAGPGRAPPGGGRRQGGGGGGGHAGGGGAGGPVVGGGLGQVQVGEPADGRRGQVGVELGHRDRAGQDDRGPGVGQGGGQGDRVLGDAVLPGQLGERRSGGAAGGQPAVGHGFLDEDGPAGGGRFGGGRGDRGLKQVPGDLGRAEQRLAVDGERKGTADGVGLVRAAGGQPDQDALVAQLGQRAQQGRVVEQAGVQGGRVDLVQRDAVAEQGAALGQLGGEHGQRVFFDLVGDRVHPPVADVAVTPLGADDHVGVVALGQPAAQKLLGPAVGPGDVDVADAGRVGRVEHGEGL